LQNGNLENERISQNKVTYRKNPGRRNSTASFMDNNGAVFQKGWNRNSAISLASGNYTPISQLSLSDGSSSGIMVNFHFSSKH